MMKIWAIRTKAGYYLTHNLQAESYHSSPFTDLFFDGKLPTPTFHKHWSFCKEQPEKITRMVTQVNINHRYELVDHEMASRRIHTVLFPNDVIVDTSLSTWNWKWNDEHKHLSSLYTLVHDELPDVEEDVKFSFEILLELDEIVEFNGFSYPVQKTRYRNEGLEDLTEQHVQHQLLDEILFPAIILPSRPCRLSSQQSYKIVREYIKQHINPKAAHITSDYDFCFTVQKRVVLHDPFESKREILTARGKSYKKRRYRKRWVKERKVIAFEMTWSPKDYKGYTPIAGFRGKNVDDLRAKIDAYLEELIALINQPLKDCPHCNGMGVVEDD